MHPSTGDTGPSTSVVADVEEWLRDVREIRDVPVVSAMVVSPGIGIFVQRRRPDAVVYPGCWAFVGGRVTAGETAVEALDREIHEETGWQLRRVHDVVAEHSWSSAGSRHRELIVAVTVAGDLDQPVLESSHTVWRWLDSTDMSLLLVNRAAGDTALHDAARKWFTELHHL